MMALLWSGFAAAQELTVEERIGAAESILQAVDEQARVCIEQLAESANSLQPEECASFLTSIDGDVLTGYLEHCAELKQWRDAYVENPPPAGPDSERDRQRLVGVERVCGENALRQRTEFVAAAFDELNERLSRRASGLSLQRRINELEFRSTLGGWQNELDVTNSNRRVRSETLQQFDQLEEELIRQQINRPRQVQY
ncbi:MAG: hypothetical protein F4030_08590 [Gammaproteobacteria bacterium]|nr:hypothetical protein [Gammaproteobacteria bacterium]